MTANNPNLWFAGLAYARRSRPGHASPEGWGTGVLPDSFEYWITNRERADCCPAKLTSDHWQTPEHVATEYQVDIDGMVDIAEWILGCYDEEKASNRGRELGVYPEELASDFSEVDYFLGIERRLWSVGRPLSTPELELLGRGVRAEELDEVLEG